MTGILAFIFFLACGFTQICDLCPRRPLLIKIWLGCVLGLMEMMWLPSLYAFRLTFNTTAQLLAIGTAALLTLLTSLFRARKNRPATVYSAPPAKTALLIMIPVALVCVWLQYTHNFRQIDGALYVGQSTYGDLCMHASFVTGLAGQTYPPEYTLLPGTTLGYPFLVDALSSTMYILGTPLSLSLVIPGSVMTILVYLGFFIFAWELTRKRSASILALILLFFCGGLGFLYTLDLSGKTGFAALKTALEGYYQAPANMPEYNLRWVNALCDLLVPQRTLMAGWLTVIPALYLLVTAIKSRRTLDFLALGLWSGPMVMIHTHSFLGLGVISLGALIDILIRDKKHRLKQLWNFGVYGILACAIALPQLMKWTFPQTIDGGSLKLLFNWVNNSGDGKLIDGYFWFWIKNVGIMFIFLPMAGLSAQKKPAKALSLGSLLLFILADCVIFQPNVYDNNKLFYVAYIAMLPLGSALVCDIYSRLKGIKLRCVLAAAFIFVSCASGAISIVRECVSQYQVFSSGAVDAAKWISDNIPRDSVILTANNHNNAPASLAGRRIVCGSSLYLYFHGLDYSTQEYNARLMLRDPERNMNLFESCGVDYIYFSSYERSEGADEQTMNRLFTPVYEGGEWYDRIVIYKVS